MYGKIKEHLERELALVEEAGLFKKENPILSPQDAEIVIAGNKKVLNFCANNYLGLSSHPALIEAARDALRHIQGQDIDNHAYYPGKKDPRRPA